MLETKNFKQEQSKSYVMTFVQQGLATSVHADQS